MGIVIGILFVLVGVFNLIMHNIKLKKCTKIVEATVVGFDVRTSDGNSSKKMYFPIYEYNVNGEKRKVISKFGKTSKKFKENEKVELRYNPDNLNQYCIPADKTIYTISYSFILGGIIFALVMIKFENN